MGWTLGKILEGARSRGASDIHLIRGVAPVLRINGDIHVSQGRPLDEAALGELIDKMLLPRQREILQERLQLCFSRHAEGVGRFRASVYFHAGCPELAIRLCERTVRTAAELGLPPVVEELTRLQNGLILLAGPTGVGKTTTLNFMIDLINHNRRAKIVTIEDPVEFVHDNLRSIVVQQEVGTDVHSFREALVHVLRQDPDVIVIGEMRDLETIETALIAAETGHLVLATLHTPDTVQTIQRIYSVFPANQQNAIIIQLASTLQAAVAQKLLPQADGPRGCWLARSSSLRRRRTITSENGKSTFCTARCRRGASCKCRRWTPPCWNSTRRETSRTMWPYRTRANLISCAIGQVRGRSSHSPRKGAKLQEIAT